MKIKVLKRIISLGIIGLVLGYGVSTTMKDDIPGPTMIYNNSSIEQTITL